MNLLKYKWIFFTISAVILIPGLISLLLFGLKPGLDFIGGSLLEVKVLDQAKSLDGQTIFDDLKADYSLESVVISKENQIIIRAEELSNEQKDILLTKLNDKLGQVEEIKFETVGPTLGKELLIKTIVAVILVAFFTILYVWYEFKDFSFGVCAILGMFHDSFILLGIFSLLGKFMKVEVDVLFVTAILTTLSFSIHDTIVIFNRIKELEKKHVREKFTTVANVAAVENLSRSINNSITIILMLVALVVLGGDTLRWFSLALLIGAIIGTYSSTFVAVPLLTVWQERKKKK